MKFTLTVCGLTLFFCLAQSTVIIINDAADDEDGGNGEQRRQVRTHGTGRIFVHQDVTGYGPPEGHVRLPGHLSLAGRSVHVNPVGIPIHVNPAGHSYHAGHVSLPGHSGHLGHINLPVHSGHVALARHSVLPLAGSLAGHARFQGDVILPEHIGLPRHTNLVGHSGLPHHGNIGVVRHVNLAGHSGVPGHINLAGHSYVSGHVNPMAHSGDPGRINLAGLSTVPETNLAGQSGVLARTNLAGHSGVPGQTSLAGHSVAPGQVNLVGHSGVVGQINLAGHSGVPGQVNLVGHSGVQRQTNLAGQVNLVQHSGVPGNVNLAGQAVVPGQVSQVQHSGVSGNLNLAGNLGLSGHESLHGLHEIIGVSTGVGSQVIRVPQVMHAPLVKHFPVVKHIKLVRHFPIVKHIPLLTQATGKAGGLGAHVGSIGGYGDGVFFTHQDVTGYGYFERLMGLVGQGDILYVGELGGGTGAERPAGLPVVSQIPVLNHVPVVKHVPMVKHVRVVKHLPVVQHVTVLAQDISKPSRIGGREAKIRGQHRSEFNSNDGGDSSRNVGKHEGKNLRDGSGFDEHRGRKEDRHGGRLGDRDISDEDEDEGRKEIERDNYRDEYGGHVGRKKGGHSSRLRDRDFLPGGNEGRKEVERDTYRDGYGRRFRRKEGGHGRRLRQHDFLLGGDEERRGTGHQKLRYRLEGHERKEEERHRGRHDNHKVLIEEDEGAQGLGDNKHDFGGFGSGSRAHEAGHDEHSCEICRGRGKQERVPEIDGKHKDKLSGNGERQKGSHKNEREGHIPHRQTEDGVDKFYESEQGGEDGVKFGDRSTEHGKPEKSHGSGIRGNRGPRGVYEGGKRGRGYTHGFKGHSGVLHEHKGENEKGFSSGDSGAPYVSEGGNGDRHNVQLVGEHHSVFYGHEFEFGGPESKDQEGQTGTLDGPDFKDQDGQTDTLDGLDDERDAYEGKNKECDGGGIRECSGSAYVHEGGNVFGEHDDVFYGYEECKDQEKEIGSVEGTCDRSNPCEKKHKEADESGIHAYSDPHEEGNANRKSVNGFGEHDIEFYGYEERPEAIRRLEFGGREGKNLEGNRDTLGEHGDTSDMHEAKHRERHERQYIKSPGRGIRGYNDSPYVHEEGNEGGYGVRGFGEHDSVSREPKESQDEKGFRFGARKKKDQEQQVSTPSGKGDKPDWNEGKLRKGNGDSILSHSDPPSVHEVGNGVTHNFGGFHGHVSLPLRHKERERGRHRLVFSGREGKYPKGQRGLLDGRGYEPDGHEGKLREGSERKHREGTGDGRLLLSGQPYVHEGENEGKLNIQGFDGNDSVPYRYEDRQEAGRIFGFGGQEEKEEEKGALDKRDDEPDDYEKRKHGEDQERKDRESKASGLQSGHEGENESKHNGLGFIGHDGVPFGLEEREKVGHVFRFGGREGKNTGEKKGTSDEDVAVFWGKRGEGQNGKYTERKESGGVLHSGQPYVHEEEKGSRHNRNEFPGNDGVPYGREEKQGTEREKAGHIFRLGGREGKNTGEKKGTSNEDLVVFWGKQGEGQDVKYRERNESGGLLHSVQPYVHEEEKRSRHDGVPYGSKEKRGTRDMTGSFRQEGKRADGEGGKLDRHGDGPDDYKGKHAEGEGGELDRHGDGPDGYKGKHAEGEGGKLDRHGDGPDDYKGKHAEGEGGKLDRHGDGPDDYKGKHAEGEGGKLDRHGDGPDDYKGKHAEGEGGKLDRHGDGPDDYKGKHAEGEGGKLDRHGDGPDDYKGKHAEGEGGELDRHGDGPDGYKGKHAEGQGGKLDKHGDGPEGYKGKQGEGSEVKHGERNVKERRKGQASGIQGNDL